jgi:hypothetical protein
MPIQRWPTFRSINPSPSRLAVVVLDEGALSIDEKEGCWDMKSLVSPPPERLRYESLLGKSA